MCIPPAPQTRKALITIEGSLSYLSVRDMWKEPYSAVQLNREANAGVYERLMLARGSDKELEIVRDLSRTYPSHVYYQQRQGPGQRSLFNVLRAYSIYDRQARPTLSFTATDDGGRAVYL